MTKSKSTETKILFSDDSLPITEHIITAYGPKLPRATTQLHFPESEQPHGRTQQHFKDEVDTNLVMRRYIETGQLANFEQRFSAKYGDFTGYDYQAAKDLVANANSMFYELPAKIRDRFENSPKAFLEFVSNDGNREEARKLGLLKPEEAPSTSQAGGPGGATPPTAPGTPEASKAQGGAAKPPA